MNKEERDDLQRLIRYIDYVGVDYAVAEVRAWWRKRIMLAIALLGASLLCIWLGWRNWIWVTNTASGFFASSLVGAVVLFSLGQFVQWWIGGRARLLYFFTAYPFIAVCRVGAAFLSLLVLARIGHYVLLALGFAHDASGTLSFPLSK